MNGETVMISIRPKWCELIASGKKTVEVRRTRPKMLAPFKCYIYQTKMHWLYELLHKNGLEELAERLKRSQCKVIGEFICDWCDVYMRKSEDITELSLESLVMPNDLYVYMGEKNYLYGWHISDLVIYDKPKELSEFYRWWDGLTDIRPCENGKDCKHIVYDYSEDCQACAIDFDGTDCPYLKVQRPPQSWCYVKELEA